MTEHVLRIGLGALAASRNHDTVLTCHGLGSCVAVTMYDPAMNVGGLLHAALPLNTNGSHALPGKYVDTGYVNLLNEMLELGAEKRRLVVRAAGGSNLLTGPAFSNLLEIGKRNMAAVELMVARESMTLAASDTGGQVGRNVRLLIRTGLMTVQRLGQEEKVLGTLGSSRMDPPGYGQRKGFACQESS